MNGGYTGGPVSDGGMDMRHRLEREAARRKPIHTSTAVGQTADGFLFRVTVATCDDGTLWRLSDNEQGREFWEQLPQIPQG